MADESSGGGDGLKVRYEDLHCLILVHLECDPFGLNLRDTFHFLGRKISTF